MKWNDHSNQQGKHALFSPSQPSFMNMTPEEFENRLYTKCRSGIGTELHEWAFYKIKRRHKVTSIKETVKAVDEYIYAKYYSKQYDSISAEGRRLLKVLTTVPIEVFNTVKAYVNDAIGFRMDPEVVVGYSDRFFGTADAISVSGGVLRIHDLKTGASPAHIEQLYCYDAYYCLEYHTDPYKIDHELRIYQNGEIFTANPTGADIRPIMDKIVRFDAIQLKFEEI